MRSFNHLVAFATLAIVAANARPIASSSKDGSSGLLGGVSSLGALKRDAQLPNPFPPHPQPRPHPHPHPTPIDDDCDDDDHPVKPACDECEEGGDSGSSSFAYASSRSSSRGSNGGSVISLLSGNDRSGFNYDHNNQLSNLGGSDNSNTKRGMQKRDGVIGILSGNSRTGLNFDHNNFLSNVQGSDNEGNYRSSGHHRGHRVVDDCDECDEPEPECDECDEPEPECDECDEEGQKSSSYAASSAFASSRSGSRSASASAASAASSHSESRQSGWKKRQGVIDYESHNSRTGVNIDHNNALSNVQNSDNEGYYSGHRGIRHGYRYRGARHGYRNSDWRREDDCDECDEDYYRSHRHGYRKSNWREDDCDECEEDYDYGRHHGGGRRGGSVINVLSGNDRTGFNYDHNNQLSNLGGSDNTNKKQKRGGVVDILSGNSRTGLNIDHNNLLSNVQGSDNEGYYRGDSYDDDCDECEPEPDCDDDEDWKKRGMQKRGGGVGILSGNSRTGLNIDHNNFLSNVQDSDNEGYGYDDCDECEDDRVYKKRTMEKRGGVLDILSGNSRTGLNVDHNNLLSNVQGSDNEGNYHGGHHHGRHGGHRVVDDCDECEPEPECDDCDEPEPECDECNEPEPDCDECDEPEPECDECNEPRPQPEPECDECDEPRPEDDCDDEDQKSNSSSAVSAASASSRSGSRSATASAAASASSHSESRRSGWKKRTA